MRHSEDLGFRVWPFLVWDSVVKTILLWQWHVSTQFLINNFEENLSKFTATAMQMHIWKWKLVFPRLLRLLTLVATMTNPRICLHIWQEGMLSVLFRHWSWYIYRFDAHMVLTACSNERIFNSNIRCTGAISKITFSIHVSKWILFLFIPQNYIFNSNSNSNGLPMQCALL